jgi:hypothetical protein
LHSVRVTAMIFSAEQHSAIARRLERRAEEEGLAPEQRADFSSRAELFRYLATAAADIAAGRRPKATMVQSWRPSESGSTTCPATSAGSPWLGI